MELDERPRRAGFEERSGVGSKMLAEAPPSEGTDTAGRFGCEGKYAFVFSDFKKIIKRLTAGKRGRIRSREKEVKRRCLNANLVFTLKTSCHLST